MSVLVSAWNAAVRGGFRLLYREMSWSYDAVSHVVSLGRWQSWRQACIPFLFGPRILELGCGPGHLQLELSELGFWPFGLDASAQMTRTAGQRLRRASQPSLISRGVSQALPYQSGRFNSVVATFPTLYISDFDTLQEIRRVLTPNGRLVIVLDAQLGDGLPLRRLIDAAYRLTGQRATEAADPLPRWSDVLCERISAVGMACEVHSVALSDSTVTLITADVLGDS